MERGIGLGAWLANVNPVSECPTLQSGPVPYCLCKASKDPRAKSPGLLHPLPIPARPWMVHRSRLQQAPRGPIGSKQCAGDHRPPFQGVVHHPMPRLGHGKGRCTNVLRGSIPLEGTPGGSNQRPPSHKPPLTTTAPPRPPSPTPPPSTHPPSPSPPRSSSSAPASPSPLFPSP